MKYFITYKYNLRGIAPNGHAARSLSKDLNSHIRRDLGLQRATPLNELNGYRSEMTLSTTSDPNLDPEFTKVYPYYQKNIYVDFKVTSFSEDKKDLLRSASLVLKEIQEEIELLKL